MSGSIALMLSKTGGPPFHGSVGDVNDAIGPILARNGWQSAMAWTTALGN